MPIGKILSISTDKGFGFIQNNDGGPDVFFHHTVVDGSFDALKVGTEARYVLDESAEKPRAASVVAESRRQQTRPLAGDRPSRYGDAQGPSRGSADHQYGFVTRLWFRQFQGFISSVHGGPEFIFDAADVIGLKPYSQLAVGDYVRFVPSANPTEPDQPQAHSVMAVERRLPSGEKMMSRHPRARGKKPTWR